MLVIGGSHDGPSDISDTSSPKTPSDEWAQRRDSPVARRVGSVLGLAHMVETVTTTVTTVKGRPFSSGLGDSAFVIFAVAGLLGIPLVSLADFLLFVSYKAPAS